MKKVSQQEREEFQELAIQARGITGLSQEAFHDVTGIPLGTVRNWEQGSCIGGKGDKILLSLIKMYPGLVLSLISGIGK